jgi:hypothetical protein|tara:strand:- start:612 stop:827 length:216 start_codon:yes stop_codon:yes gene_type:complete
MSNKASLFKFEANLLTNGKVELLCESVRPEEFEGVINNGLPEYDGAHSIASLLRYLKSWSDEAIDKSARYI